MTGTEYTVVVRPLDGSLSSPNSARRSSPSASPSRAEKPHTPRPGAWKWLRTRGPEAFRAKAGGGAETGPPQWNLGEVYVSCCDGMGLGCELARVIFENGLSVIQGDFSTDGRFCFLMFVVTPISAKPHEVRSDWWEHLQHQLEDVCPKNSFWTGLDRMNWYLGLRERQFYMLSIETNDRVGLLKEIAHTCWLHDFTMHGLVCEDQNEAEAEVQGTGASQGVLKVRDHVQVSDNIDGGPQRVEDLASAIAAATAGHCSWSSVTSPRTQRTKSRRGFTPWQSLHSCHQKGKINGATKNLVRYIEGGGAAGLKGLDAQFSLEVDNWTSPTHTALHIRCRERRGLFYDVMRALKDLQLQGNYGRIEANVQQLVCSFTLFVQDADGGKIVDEEVLQRAEFLMEKNITAPFWISLQEQEGEPPLLKLDVVTRVDGNGRGRPRILLDTVHKLAELDLDGPIVVRKAAMFVSPIGGGNEDSPQPFQRFRNLVVLAGEQEPMEEHHVFWLLLQGGHSKSAVSQHLLRNAVLRSLVGISEEPRTNRRRPRPPAARFTPVASSAPQPTLASWPSKRRYWCCPWPWLT